MSGFITQGDTPEAPQGYASEGYQENTPENLPDYAQAALVTGGGSAIGTIAKYGQMMTRQGMQDKVSADEIQKQYGFMGPDGKPVRITDEPMEPGVAELVANNKKAQLDRENVISRFENSHSTLTNLAAGTVAYMSDPLQAAASLLPGVGEETALGALTARGFANNLVTRTAARVGSGAVGGAAGYAPIAGVQYGLGQQEGSDYDLRSAFKDMAFSAAGGAILQGGFGALGDAWKARGAVIDKLKAPDKSTPEAEQILNADAPTKDAAMRSSVSQVMDGRQVNVDSIFPQAGQETSLADFAQKQQEIYREGYEPGLTSDELKSATDEILPPKTEEKEPRIPQNTSDLYKKTVADESQRLGLNLTDDQITSAARAMAESHIPENVEKPRSLEEVQNGVKATKGALNAGETAPRTPTLQEKIQPVPVENFPDLPRELSKGAPRFQQSEVSFANGVDKALYIVREKSSGVSKAHDKYMSYLKDTVGLSDAEIKRGSESVLQALKKNAGAKGDAITLPKIFTRVKASAKPTVQTPYAKIPKEPMRLIAWIKRQGGIKDTGGDVAASIGGAKGRAGLINNKTGRFPDDLALMAHENGYFSGEERPDVNTLLEKIRADHQESPQYSFHDTNAVQEYNDALNRNAEIDKIAYDTGIDPAGKTHSQFWDEVNKHLSEEAAAAKEEELGRQAQESFESWRTEALEPEELEALENERAKENNARDLESIPQNTERPGNAAGDEGTGEAVAGLGRRDVEPTGSEAESGEAQRPGSERDAEIANLESRIDLSKLTNEEKAELNAVYANADAAKAAYEQKLKELASCFAENGV